MDKRIVCNCNIIRAHQVKEVIDEFPFFSMETVRSSLNIGTRCGSCLKKDCKIIDVSLHELHDLYKYNKDIKD